MVPFRLNLQFSGWGALPHNIIATFQKWDWVPLMIGIMGNNHFKLQLDAILQLDCAKLVQQVQKISGAWWYEKSNNQMLNSYKACWPYW